MHSCAVLQWYIRAVLACVGEQVCTVDINVEVQCVYVQTAPQHQLYIVLYTNYTHMYTCNYLYNIHYIGIYTYKISVTCVVEYI